MAVTATEGKKTYRLFLQEISRSFVSVDVRTTDEVQAEALLTIAATTGRVHQLENFSREMPVGILGYRVLEIVEIDE